MTSKSYKRFKPLFDWSTWCMIALCVICILCPLLLDADWIMTTVITGGALLCLIPLCSIRYEIEGDELVVRLFLSSSRFPISKIKAVKPIKTLICAPATSFTDRIAIEFSDRRILKSVMPLVISPADKDDFIKTLISINPEIKTTM